MTDGASRGPVLADLARFVTELSDSSIPEATRGYARRVLRHNLLVALAARAERIPGQDATRWPVDLPAAVSSLRLTDGRRAPTELAVVTNALAMGARAQHDEHPAAVSHFGSVVIPPLLAVAEQHDIDGRLFLTSMVAGYEVGARIGSALVSKVAGRGFRPTSVFGPVAAAAAVGKALGFDTHSLVSAMALAANTSAGLSQTWLSGTDEWRYQTALAGRNGHQSALLAAQGVRGATVTMEGRNGFARAFAAEAESTAYESMLAGLGESWAVDDVLLKAYPVCALNQAAVQQVIGLRTAIGPDGAAIDRVRVFMNPDDARYPGVDVWPPTVLSRAAALMNMRTCVAIAILHAGVPLEALDAAGVPAVRDLERRIEVIPDRAVASHLARVEIVDLEGRTFASGAPGPLIYDDAVFAELLSTLVPLTGIAAPRIADLVERIGRLSERQSMRALIATMADDLRVAAPGQAPRADGQENRARSRSLD